MYACDIIINNKINLGEIKLENTKNNNIKKIFNIQGYAEDFLYSYYYAQSIFDAIEINKTVHHATESEEIIDFEKLCKDLKLKFDLNLILSNDKSQTKWFISSNPSNFLYVSFEKSEMSEETNICVLTTDQKKKNEILKFIKLYTKTKKEKSRLIHMLCPNEYGPGETFHPIGEAGFPIEKDNYEFDVVSDFDYIVSELNSKLPNGRLVIIDGPSGSGKSFFIRGILSEIKFATCVLLPSAMIEKLDKPTIISVLLKERQNSKAENDAGQPVVVIIEDADQCLVPRAADNMSAISNLLNYTDGIFGSIFDLRIIATTNAKQFQMDKALSRSGRLLKRVHIDLLKPRRAEDIYKRLTGKEIQFKKEISLADIYAKSKGVVLQEQKEEIDSKLGFE